MNNKVKIVIFILFFIAFAGACAMDVKVTLDTHEDVVSLCDGNKLGKEEKSVVNSWKELNRDRAATVCFVAAFFGITFALVLKAGTAPNEKVRLSDEEVLTIVNDIKQEYADNDLLVEETDEEAFLDTINELDTPKIKPLVYKNSGVLLQWYSVEYANAYYLYKKINKSKWKKLATVASPKLSYTDIRLDSDTTYDYTVRAVLKTEEKEIYSNVDQLGKEIYIKEGNLLPPPNVFATKDANGNPAIGWDAVDNACDYRIYKKDNKEKWTEIGFVEPDSELCYFDEDMLKNEGIEYTVGTSNRVGKRLLRGNKNKTGVKF